jgi:hypothetical protein
MRFRSHAIRSFIAPRGTGNTVSESRSDGAIEFKLSARSNGIFVERRQLRIGAGLSSHAMHFSDENSFLAWCEADALKFSYPLVYSRLKRHGCALLASDQPGSRAA